MMCVDADSSIHCVVVCIKNVHNLHNMHNIWSTMRRGFVAECAFTRIPGKSDSTKFIRQCCVFVYVLLHRR